MAYSAEISRNNPSCFLFLIDQSGSMDDSIGTSGEEINKKRADAVADALNKLLQTLVIKCAKQEGVRDYFYIGVIGYGNQVGPAFGGALAGQELVPISSIAQSPARIEERVKREDDGAGGLLERKIKFPVWFEPLANGGTPMVKALNQAQNIARKWLDQHPSCFPPTILNLTDGESTNGDPSQAAQQLTQLASSDGNVLLYNSQISSTRAARIEFPDNEQELPDQYAKLLFRMSSKLPEHTRNFAASEGYRVSENTRGFVFNADFVSIIKFLDIGTRATNLR